MTRRLFDYLFSPFYVVWIVLSIATCCIVALSGVAIKREAINDFAHLLYGRLVCLPFFVRLENKNNIAIPRKAVFIANHTSYFDIPSVFCVFPQIRFLSKIELRKIPFMGFSMANTGHFFVDRKNNESRKQVIEQIKATPDVDLMMFPEGTRNSSPSNGILEFRGGAFKLAKDLGVPLVLIYIEGAYQALNKKEVIPHFFRPITVHVLGVMTEPDPAKAYQEINNFNRRVYNGV